MARQTNQATASQNRSWYIASRWQELDGEMRTALLRGILVIAFYSVQLINYVMTDSIQEAGRTYHRQITMAALAWLCLSLAIFITLKGSFFPSYLKYVSTTIDLAIIGVLAYLGKGAASPLVFTLFIIIVLSALRFSLGLVWYSTLVAMCVYMILVGASDAKWFDAVHETPVLTQAILLLSFGSCGVICGQIIRSTRRMAEEYQTRLDRMNAEAQS
jgi:hypothetical protein